MFPALAMSASLYLWGFVPIIPAMFPVGALGGGKRAPRFAPDALLWVPACVTMGRIRAAPALVCDLCAVMLGDIVQAFNVTFSN